MKDYVYFFIDFDFDFDVIVELKPNRATRYHKP